MFRTALAVLVLTIGLTTGSLAQPVADARPLEDRVRDWFEPLLETRDFSGVIMIRQGGNLPAALTFGYADWVTGEPMRADARFPTGSITKSLTAAMAHQLIDEDRLAPDTAVSRFVPELAGYDRVRIGDILGHTAGLPRDVPPGALADSTSDTLVAWLADQPAPGAGPHAYAYSNVGYGLLAVIIERAVNARFETLLTTEFLIPLDLQRSRIVRQDGSTLAGVPTGYSAGPLPLDLRAPMANTPALGASGLVAPVEDLLRLADAVASRRIDLFEPDGRMTGSWSVEQLNGETIYTIQGSVPGYSAGISVLPGRDITIAYGTSLESYPNWEIRDVLHALALGLPVAPAASRPATDRLTSGHLEAVGTYSGSPFGPVALRQTEGGLDLVLTERDWRFYLTPTGIDTFNWRLFNTDMTLERDAAGRVAAITANQAGLTGDGRAYRLERTDLPPLPPAATETTEN